MTYAMSCSFTAVREATVALSEAVAEARFAKVWAVSGVVSEVSSTFAAWKVCCD